MSLVQILYFAPVGDHRKSFVLLKIPGVRIDFSSA